MSESGGIMGRLREETAEQHQRAESNPFEQAMVRGVLPRDSYVQMLEQRYLIHRCLEQHVRELRESHPFVGQVVLDTLFQEQNLAEDLAHFHVDPGTVTPLRATQALIEDIQATAAQTPLALLGFYYVFEGSKNGARFVAKRVGTSLELTSGAGMRYLDPHGDQQRPLWMDFKARMDGCGFQATDQDAMVEAAKRTFERIIDLDHELYEQTQATA